MKRWGLLIIALISILIVAACGGAVQLEPTDVQAHAYVSTVNSLADLEGFGGESAIIEQVIKEEDYPHFMMVTVEWETEIDASGRFDVFIREPEEWFFFSYRGRHVDKHDRDRHTFDLVQQNPELLGWSHEPGQHAKPFRLLDISSGHLTALYKDLSNGDMLEHAANLEVYIGYIGQDKKWAIEVPFVE